MQPTSPIASIVGGVIALLLIATIVYLLIAPAVFLRMHPPPPGITEVGFDLSSLITKPLYWLISIVAFGVGFYWSFRRS